MSSFSRKTRRVSKVNSPRPRCRPQLETLEDRRVLSFGTGGVVITDVLATTGEWIENIALQADGRIVAAGNWGGGGDVARYNADGSLDTTFNPGGSQPGTVTPDGFIHDIALQADGKIVAGGQTWTKVDEAFLVRRFSADGTPDSSFGSGGAVTTNLTKGKSDGIEALAIQPDQKIVVVGLANSSWAVVRYNTNGSLDTSFDRDGKVTTTFGGKTSGPMPHAVVVQSDGKILVAGEVYGSFEAKRDFALVRYNTDGSLDQGFGQGGKVLTDFASERGSATSNDKAYDMALQDNGKIVVVGNSNTGTDHVAIARYNPNGTLDSSFGGNGMVTLDGRSSGVTRFLGVALQPSDPQLSDQKIVAVGGGISSLAARFNADGSLDASFDGDGLKYSLFGSNPSYADDVLVQPDGKILVGGSTGWDSDAKFALARLNADGTYDAAAALVAAGSPAAKSSVDTLARVQLQPLLAEAVARWGAAGADTADLAGVSIRIADLGGNYLGMASGDTIWLDDDAAGWGWFADPTPGDASEFTTAGNQGEKGRMDLLTVLMHELGHVLGLDHDDGGLMQETLAAGTRLPLDEYFAQLALAAAKDEKQ